MALNSNFKPQFTSDQLKEELRRRVGVIKTLVVNEMQYAGEKGVIEARDPSDESKDYRDRTSNLRKSTGYFIFDNNLKLVGNFVNDVAGTVGASVGEQKAKDIGNKFPKGLTFVMVAGMVYGPWVEARGYNVLTPAAILVETEINKQLIRLVARINSKKAK